MTLAVKDRVRETSATAGTGTLTLAGAVSGFQAFSVIGDANTTYYGIVDATTGDWEVGIGTYTLSGTTLSRTTVLSSSNAGSLVNFAANSKDVFVTYPSSKSVYYDASSNLPITGETTISVSSASDALRITQTGSGKALLVEDSANPDATPFVIDSGGNVIKGNDTAVLYSSGVNPQIQLNIAGAGTMGISRWSANTANNALVFLKSRGATIGDFTSVTSGDNLGSVNFYGTDGTAGILAARIESAVDGTPGLNDMPGRLVFSTTADGASTPTERMRINSAGSVGIGASYLTGYNLRIEKTLTGSTSASGIAQDSTIQSDVTTEVYGYRSALATQAAAFTLPALFHVAINQGTFGAASAVTSQFGIIIGSTLTGATNNYGFYGNIASGTGRWNFYANGTANNYMAGALGIGTTSLTGFNLRVAKALTGSTTSYNVLSDTTIQSDVTSTAYVFRSLPNTQAAVFTLSNLSHFSAGLNNLGAGSVITTQMGFRAESILTRATNNYGFYGDIASGTGRWNFFANGTASNYFAGDVLIGTTTPDTSTPKLDIIDSGGIQLVMSNVVTTATTKTARFGARHYTSTEEPFGFYLTGTSTNNAINYGGGTALFNAATTHSFYTAANNTTTTGTERMRIDSAGSVGIGTTSLTGYSLHVAKAITGGVSAFGIAQDSTIQSDVTTAAYGYVSSLATQAAAFTLVDLYHVSIAQGTFGAGSAVTSQYGVIIGSTLTGATNNYGFLR
jgi:hypothetical protein